MNTKTLFTALLYKNNKLTETEFSEQDPGILEERIETFIDEGVLEPGIYLIGLEVIKQ